jgi:hypothetical protein
MNRKVVSPNGVVIETSPASDVVLEALDVGDERAAAVVEQRERALDVGDVEDDRAHPSGCLRR